jgi:hypothetical protein
MHPRRPRCERSTVNAMGEIRDAARLGKKDCGLPHASHAAGRISRVIRAKRNGPSRACESRRLDCGQRWPPAHEPGRRGPQRLDQRDAVLFLPFGAAAAAFGAGHGAW